MADGKGQQKLASEIQGKPQSEILVNCHQRCMSPTIMGGDENCNLMCVGGDAGKKPLTFYIDICENTLTFYISGRNWYLFG